MLARLKLLWFQFLWLINPFINALCYEKNDSWPLFDLIWAIQNQAFKDKYKIIVSDPLKFLKVIFVFDLLKKYKKQI